MDTNSIEVAETDEKLKCGACEFYSYSQEDVIAHVMNHDRKIWADLDEEFELKSEMDKK